MFSETRYAMNGDLRIAYRASPQGPRDIVFAFPLPQTVRSFRSWRRFKGGSRR